MFMVFSKKYSQCERLKMSFSVNVCNFNEQSTLTYLRLLTLNDLLSFGLVRRDAWCPAISDDLFAFLCEQS